jgi:uncharacterized protein with PIN domain
MHVVDSSGWIEYLLDSPRADLFATAIEARSQLLVPTIALFEVCKILGRTLEPALVASCLDVMRMGRVVDLTDARAVAAAAVSRQHRLAQEHGATLWTQDADYDGLPGVRYLPKAI